MVAQSIKSHFHLWNQVLWFDYLKGAQTSQSRPSYFSMNDFKETLMQTEGESKDCPNCASSKIPSG